MEPQVTLLHFAEPVWFASAGGFENAANIAAFVQYGLKMVEEFGLSKVCTINEPAVRAFMGYVLGKYPPHRRLRPALMRTVLTNQLKAHMQAYHAIKSVHGASVQVGIVHDILAFRPFHQEGWRHFLEKAFTNKLTRLTNGIVMQFFTTGETSHNTNTPHYYRDMRKKGDFFGINFYGRLVIKIGRNQLNRLIGPAELPGEPLGRMLTPYDPAGFKAAVLDAWRDVKLPIHITEFGFADEIGQDTNRERTMRAYLQVIDEVLAEGVDIRGVYAWTTQQGYEWDFNGTKPRIEHVDLGLFNKDCTMRGSALAYKEWIAAQTGSLQIATGPAQPSLQQAPVTYILALPPHG